MTDVPPLTDRQRTILDMVYDVLMRDGRRATYREIAAVVGITYTGVALHFSYMDKKGYIELSRPNGKVHMGRRGGVTDYRLLRWPDGSPFLGLTRPPPCNTSTSTPPDRTGSLSDPSPTGPRPSSASRPT